MVIEYAAQNFNTKVVEITCLGLDFNFEGRSQFYKAPLVGLV